MDAEEAYTVVLDHNGRARKVRRRSSGSAPQTYQPLDKSLVTYAREADSDDASWLETGAYGALGGLLATIAGKGLYGGYRGFADYSPPSKPTAAPTPYHAGASGWKNSRLGSTVNSSVEYGLGNTGHTLIGLGVGGALGALYGILRRRRR